MSTQEFTDEVERDEPVYVDPDAPVVLQIAPCPICPKNTVNGECSFCGYGMTGSR